MTSQSVVFHVRPATLDDLDTLISFTLAEAQEAEGLDLVPEPVSVLTLLGCFA